MSEDNPDHLTKSERNELEALRHIMMAIRHLPKEVREGAGVKYVNCVERDLRMLCARTGIAYEVGGVGARIFMAVSPEELHETVAKPTVIGVVLAGNFSKQDIEMVGNYFSGLSQDGIPAGTRVTPITDFTAGDEGKEPKDD